MIKIIELKDKTLYNQQKQTHQRLIQEQRVCLQSLIVLCISKLVQTIMVMIVFVSWERTDIFQISNFNFYYNRYLILTNDLLKAMGCFGIQLSLEDNSWSSRYKIPKNDR